MIILTAKLNKIRYSVHDSFEVCLFSLSLMGTAFAWFSYLAPNCIDSWNKLEQKFHDHFFSGNYQLKIDRFDIG
jgi:hypothetical protein